MVQTGNINETDQNVPSSVEEGTYCGKRGCSSSTYFGRNALARYRTELPRNLSGTNLRCFQHRVISVCLSRYESPHFPSAIVCNMGYPLYRGIPPNARQMNGSTHDHSSRLSESKHEMFAAHYPGVICLPEQTKPTDDHCHLSVS